MTPPITNQALREKLSQGYEKNNLDFINQAHSDISDVLVKLKTKGKYFTCDYASLKADDYKQKYKIDIQEFQYSPIHIDYGLIEDIKTYLEDKNQEPVGFYAYNVDTKHHVDAFIVHDNKILVLQTSLYAGSILKVLKKNFDADKIYVQRKIEQDDGWNTEDIKFYYHPQNDGISCPAFALKYLKECLKDDAKLLSMTQFIPSGNLNTTNNQFILHPAIERYSQSDNYYTQAKEVWQKNYQSDESDALLAKADDWRNAHDKTRMMYYLLKGLSNESGYKKLGKVKQDIIKSVLNNDDDSVAEAIYF